MNKVMVLGNLVRDPKMEKVCKFTIAVNEKYKDEKKTHYIDCAAFGKTGENIEKYFSKGREILIEGRLSQSRWEKDGKKRSKLEVIAEKFFFTSGRPTERQEPEEEDYSEPPF